MKTTKILIPEIIADSVSQEHANKLMEIFNVVMKNNSFFSASIHDNEKGRDTIYTFMNHWLEGYNKSGRWIDDNSGYRSKI